MIAAPLCCLYLCNKLKNMAVPGYVLKHKRTTLERAEKFISTQYFTDCNLQSRYLQIYFVVCIQFFDWEKRQTGIALASVSDCCKPVIYFSKVYYCEICIFWLYENMDPQNTFSTQLLMKESKMVNPFCFS